MAIGTVVALAATVVILPWTGGGAVIVAGPSMEPEISVGSLALISPIDTAGPVPGEVVTLRTGTGVLVTHRVVRVANLDSVQYVETKGDANPEVDPVLSPVGTIVGKVWLVIPFAGYVEWALARPVGLIALLALVAAAWIGAGVLREIGGRPRPAGGAVLSPTP